ncbi:methionine--tRNA ligase, partial [Vibrio parahaemolyticus V-223/04]
ILACNA